MDETRSQILDVAEQLAQSRGFNAFSYRDIAQQVGIRPPSIHYHFASKDDLGVSLVERYRNNFAEGRTRIDRRAKSAGDRLRRFAGLFRNTLMHENRICLCGMLSAEFATLTPAIQKQVRLFWKDNEHWLTNTLDDGQASGALKLKGDTSARAKLFLAGLEGAMLAARVAGDLSHFDDILDVLLKDLTAK
jgi:TetR/AcrR family transcriptional repressor of nem operon